MGEAVSVLPAGIKNESPEIKWAAIMGMRNRLIHEYFVRTCCLYGMLFGMNCRG